MAGAPVLAFYLNDNLLTLVGARLATTNAFIDDATVRVTIVDRREQEVSGQTWPTTMVSAGYSGIYRCTLSGTVDFKKNEFYTGQIEFNPSGSPRAYWEQPIEIVARTN